MINKISQYDIRCDNPDCGEVDVYDGFSKRDAIAHFREYGWSVGKKDLCAKCKKALGVQNG